MNAINGLDPGQYGDYDDMFNSGNDNYPWLAIDLGFLYKVFFLYKLLKLTTFGCVNVKVTGVSMVERTACCADRTTDINIRVGMKNPPADGTGGDAEITENKLCGIFVGPGELGATSVLNCDGEYI